MSYRIFNQIRLAGVSAAVPDHQVFNHQLSGSAEEVQKIANMVGIHSRYLAPQHLCSSDLCYAAAQQLLADLAWEAASIDALIFVSQTPDYLLPATSCLLQDKLGLSKNCAAFDISLGCSGYLYGLLVAYSLVAKNGIRRVLLLVGETVSKLISPEDIAANVLFGDAGTATAIEFDEHAGSSVVSVGTDGAGASSLIIDAGGFRKPRSSETGVRKPHPRDKVLRAENDLYMDGSSVFSFTLTQVPLLVQELLRLANITIESVDYWFFHQANQFMLDYLAKKIGIDPVKMPSNIDRFGNTSPPSIPLLMVTESHQYDKQMTRVGMVGFGVGFSWGGAILNMDNPVISPLIKIKKSYHES